jgi:hypothetical protein
MRYISILFITSFLGSTFCFANQVDPERLYAEIKVSDQVDAALIRSILHDQKYRNKFVLVEGDSGNIWDYGRWKADIAMAATKTNLATNVVRELAIFYYNSTEEATAATPLVQAATCMSKIALIQLGDGFRGFDFHFTPKENREYIARLDYRFKEGASFVAVAGFRSYEYKKKLILLPTSYSVEAIE